jgi:hypothetical protein
VKVIEGTIALPVTGRLALPPKGPDPAALPSFLLPSDDVREEVEGS